MSHNAEQLLNIEQTILSYNGHSLQQVADQRGIKTNSLRNHLQENYGPSVSIKEGVITVDSELLHQEIEDKINSLIPRSNQKNNNPKNPNGFRCLPKDDLNYGNLGDSLDIMRTTIFLDKQRQINEDMLVQRVRQGKNIKIL